MSVKINKNGKEYPLGFVPQSLYDDVENLKEDVFRGSVSVDADGEKTASTLLDELFALIDPTKISERSILIQTTAANRKIIYKLFYISPNYYGFSLSNCTASVFGNTTILVKASNSECRGAEITTTPAMTITDISTEKHGVGAKYTLVY